MKCGPREIAEALEFPAMHRRTVHFRRLFRRGKKDKKRLRQANEAIFFLRTKRFEFNFLPCFLYLFGGNGKNRRKARNEWEERRKRLSDGVQTELKGVRWRPISLTVNKPAENPSFE